MTARAAAVAKRSRARAVHADALAATGLAKPTRRPPRALESAQGRALMHWADLEVRTGHRPKLAFLRHIPNGGARDKATAGKLKAEGVRRGTWDYVLPVVARWDLHDDWQSTLESALRYPGMWIELKIETERNRKNGGLSDEQLEFGKHLLGEGYACVVAYTWEEARDAIVAYLDGETTIPHFFRPEGVTCATKGRRL